MNKDFKQTQKRQILVLKISDYLKSAASYGYSFSDWTATQIAHDLIKNSVVSSDYTEQEIIDAIPDALNVVKMLGY